MGISFKWQKTKQKRTKATTDTKLEEYIILNLRQNQYAAETDEKYKNIWWTKAIPFNQDPLWELGNLLEEA